MITIDTIYSQLEEALNINQVDSVFSRDYLMDLVNQQRVLWMRNEYNKNKRSIDPNIIQDLKCVPLELVSAVNCCDAIPLDCKVLRTKYKIPNTIEFYNNKAITDVGPVNMTSIKFNFIEYKRVPYSGTSKYSFNSVFAFLYNGYMYIYSKNEDILLLEYINIRGVFEDPLEALKLADCSVNDPDKVCLDFTEDYPLNMWMWEYIRPVIVDQMMKKQVIPLDEMNNTKDEKTELSGRSK